MMIDGAFNSDRLIEYIKLLVKDAGRKVILVLDNLRVHHSKPFKKWVGEHRDEIEVFFLPSSSPELNPDERLNADLKHKITTTAPSRTRRKLEAVTIQRMELIERSPERVIKYFGDPHISYAANHNI
jgi:transposase